MNHTSRGEQITAIVSALLAVTLLAVGVAANQSKRTAGERIAQLESDLRLQLDVAYRRNPAEKRVRLEQLDAALQAWRTADRAAQNDQLMIVWLEDAIIRSMPGSAGKLPQAPQFASTDSPNEAEAKEAVVARSTAKKPQVTDQKPVARGDSDLLLSEADQAMIRQKGALQPIPLDESASNSSENSPSGPAVVQNPFVHAESNSNASRGAEEQPVVAAIAKASPPADRPAPDPADVARSYNLQEPPTPNLKPNQTSQRTPPEPKRVLVNLDELATRVAAYHDGLDILGAQLKVRGGALSMNQISRVVDRIEELQQQYVFVKLYYDALSSQARRRVVPPRPPHATVEAVRRALKRSEQTEIDFLTVADSGKPLRYRELEERLAALLRE